MGSVTTTKRSTGEAIGATAQQIERCAREHERSLGTPEEAAAKKKLQGAWAEMVVLTAAVDFAIGDDDEEEVGLWE